KRRRFTPSRCFLLVSSNEPCWVASLHEPGSELVTLVDLRQRLFRDPKNVNAVARTNLDEPFVFLFHISADEANRAADRVQEDRDSLLLHGVPSLRFLSML